MNFFSSFSLSKLLLLPIAPIIALLVSLKMALLGLGIFIVLDLITGFHKYKYVNKIKASIFKKEFWTALKSNGLRDSYNKTGEYLFAILMVILFESLILGISSIEVMGKAFSLSEIAVGIACVIEIYSIFENREVYTKRNILKRITLLFPDRVQKFFKSK